MSEEEIEYLDEDEEIIQQILQKPEQTSKENVQTVQYPSSPDDQEELNQKISLLVERKQSSKRKAKLQESDSDYDPAEDFKTAPPPRKRSRHDSQKPKTYPGPSKSSKVSQFPQRTLSKKSQSAVEYEKRKMFEIRIPDFEDPLCLPVQAMRSDKTDLQKLRNWNNTCLDWYKNDAAILEPENGKIIGSSRVIAFKNITNKHSGSLKTTVMFSSVTRSESGEKQLSQFHAILPQYREKRVFSNYKMVDASPTTKIKHSHEILLTKETLHNEEVLVAYNPKDAVSAVYKLVNEDRNDASPRRVLAETVLTKMCAPCYQVSSRRVGSNEKEPIQCSICKRSFVSVYNMLSHLKTHHKNEEVRKHKLALSRSLAKAVDYHYRCRICLTTCPTIKHLKGHINTHKGEETFRCEVGNHSTC